jgi:hypothetical protein
MKDGYGRVRVLKKFGVDDQGRPLIHVQNEGIGESEQYLFRVQAISKRLGLSQQRLKSDLADAGFKRMPTAPTDLARFGREWTAYVRTQPPESDLNACPESMDNEEE